MKNIISEVRVVSDKEKELNEAARVLNDEIWPIVNKLEKACLILQNLNDEYFGEYGMDIEKNQPYILWDFKKNITYAEIIDDYVFQAKEALRDLNERGKDKLSEEKVTA